MYGKIKEHLQQELAEIKAAGLYKSERVIESPQRAEIEVAGRKVLNFCANNYLGLSDNPRLIEAAKRAMDNRGYGMSSVRFICGCQDIHKQLEKAIADYFGTEDTILYAACFDANGGVFEPIFGQEDAIISDSLNHASIIDGVRLCKAVRTATPTPTWPSWRSVSSKRRRSVSASSAQMGSSRWTAMPRRWTRSARWPRNTTRW